MLNKLGDIKKKREDLFLFEQIFFIFNFQSLKLECLLKHCFYLVVDVLTRKT